MKKWILFLMLSLVVLVGCHKPIGPPSDALQLKSETFAGNELISDTLSTLRIMEIAQQQRGEKGVFTGIPKVISKTIVDPPEIVADIVASPWSEDWIVQRKESRVVYHITFSPCQTGGVYIDGHYPPEPIAF